jgi:hypothetical protein
MKKSTVVWMVGLVLAASLSANATVVFSDDFSGDLSKWNLVGSPDVGYPVINSSQQLEMNPWIGMPWCEEATTNAVWTTPGKYTLEFDNFACFDNGYQVFTTMPGGLQLVISPVNNPPQVYWQGTLMVSPGTFLTYAQNNHYVMIEDGRNVQIWANGALWYNQTMSSDPDFVNYNSIRLHTQTSVRFATTWDNVTLNYVPEPATIGFIGMGLAGLVGRRKSC